MTLSARDPQRSFFDVSFLAENLFGGIPGSHLHLSFNVEFRGHL